MALNLTDTIWTPEGDLSLWRTLELAASDGGSVTVADVTHSYAELMRRADSLADGFRRAGVAPGDRIATIMADSMSFVEVFFAALRAQAILVPLNPYLKGRFLSYQLAESEPTLLVVDAQGLAASKEMYRNIPSIQKIALIDDCDTSGISVPAAPISSFYLTGIHEGEYDHDGRRPFLILYTSGTTGMPKGCILTQGSMTKIPSSIAYCYGIRGDDVVLTSLPLFHMGAISLALLPSIITGASVHMPGRFSASTYFEEAAQAKATISSGLGSMGHMLLAQPPKASDKMHKLRRFVLVPFPVKAQLAFKERFGTDVFSESFGQTEGLGAMSRVHEARNPASSGQLMPWVDLAILDANGHKLKPGQAGEICSRPLTSGTMFQGYWKKPEATLSTWSGLWHHTGDRGYLDENGFLFFLDRIKDSIRRRGENIASAEVETAIAEHPKIAEVAIHAVPSSVDEDDVKACIILRKGEKVTPEELFDFFRDNLPYFAVPRYVEIFKEFPRTASLKVQKAELRQHGNSSTCWDFDEMGLKIGRDERRSGSSVTSKPKLASV